MSAVETEALAIQAELRQRQADLEIARAQKFETWANAITGTSNLALEAKATYLELALACRIAANLILSPYQNQ